MDGVSRLGLRFGAGKPAPSGAVHWPFVLTHSQAYSFVPLLAVPWISFLQVDRLTII